MIVTVVVSPLCFVQGQEELSVLISEREIFDQCGPVHLTAIDWCVSSFPCLFS